MKPSRQLMWVLAALGVGAVLALVFFFNPATTHLLPTCPFHALTGLYCPGCGSTRALHRLMHGDVEAALRFNPLMVATLPVLGVLLIRRDSATVRPVWIWLLLAVVIGYGVLRNIPVHPFTLLAPQT
jgi:hypothetical protein